MPRSFRIDPELERRLCEVAEREGVPVSAVVREAIEKHCDAVLGTSLREALADFIGIGDSGVGGLADDTGRAFTDLLLEKQARRRRAAVDDSH